MKLQLFGHPFSSYTMKVLIALYENDDLRGDDRRLAPVRHEDVPA